MIRCDHRTFLLWSTCDGILVTISGTENVDDGESIIGHTEKGGTFKDVKEFLKTQGFEEK